MNKNSRIIFHIDMNSFFASCEMKKDESLRDKPIVIANLDPLDRGLIVSPSYEARKYGIHATMIVRDAKKLCPFVKVIESDYKYYKENSLLFYNYLLGITNLVEMASIDEAFIDVTSLNLGKDYLLLAKKIQDDLWNKYKLPSSIGIAPNKYLAKIASDIKKPMGITVLRKKDLETVFYPLPIGSMLGIGKKTEPKLISMGINTVGDLVNYDRKLLKEKMGENFVNTMIYYATGNDDSKVITEREKQSSISCDHTYINRIYDRETVCTTIKELINELLNRLFKERKKALNIGIKIKSDYCNQITRSVSLEKATNDFDTLYYNAKNLFDDYFNEDIGLRMIGVYSTRLEEKDTNKQISIFDDFEKVEKEEELNKLLNDINDKYGKNSVKKGL